MSELKFMFYVYWFDRLTYQFPSVAKRHLAILDATTRS